MTAPVTVVLIDGHSETRAALTSAFGRDPEFDLLANTADADEAVGLCRNHRPRVILVDARRLEQPVESCRALAAASPASRLVVFATFFRPGEQRQYMEIGAAACLLKGEPFRDLAKRLKALAESIE